MKLSVDSRGWMWAALLLLAAAYTAEADGNDTAPVKPVEKSNDTSLVTTTVPPSKGNETTSKVPPVPPTSPNATSPTTRAAVTNHTTAASKAPVVTNSSITTATTKEPVKTTSVNATTNSPVTSSISATLQKKSGFDLGSFMGGIVLTIFLLASVYFGCRFYNSKRGVRYRTIDEHEAII
ncbi:porimin [Phyllobates terribilis]|uniref:porimin n=1 Tax=Phyllobates terribilis TaxID=111132 RepID=UPI003CCA9E28